ncbi:MAG TPA: 8-oxo-dGTP diphosphatase MutT [Hyphomonadaceae bacterium]|nr:8-oxo-dGTP diphosphatase MutT [Hyphomonadaceae bacterium]
MQIGDNPASARRLLLVAAAALIDAQGRVLIAQRPAHKALGGLWEFPGGKVEPGESPEVALARELREELDLIVEPDALDPFAFASHAYPDFHLLMPLYLAKKWQGELKLNADAAQAIAWVRARELRDYPMPPADAVLVERLIEREAANAHRYASSSTSQYK